jgi:hemerythrin
MGIVHHRLIPPEGDDAVSAPFLSRQQNRNHSRTALFALDFTATGRAKLPLYSQFSTERRVVQMTTAVRWTTDLAVGNELVDQQHQELFSRFHELLEACKERKGKEKVVALLDFLSAYVVEHFQAEEQLMQQHHYPEYESHRQQHQHFIGKLATLRQDLEQEGATVSLVIATNQAVLQWLIEHIKRVDSKLGAFLR